MIEVIRVTCEHGLSVPILRHNNGWTGMLNLTETVTEDDGSRSFRYPLRCAQCGYSPSFPLVADANQEAFDKVIDCIAAEGRSDPGTTSVVSVRLRVVARLLGHLNESCGNPACRLHAA